MNDDLLTLECADDCGRDSRPGDKFDPAVFVGGVPSGTVVPKLAAFCTEACRTAGRPLHPGPRHRLGKDLTPAELVAAGYKQVSRKYRLVARLPEGKTGMEALEAHAPDTARNFRRMAEEMAASQYLRIYADRDGNQVELTPEEFEEFRKAGGVAA